MTSILFLEKEYLIYKTLKIQEVMIIIEKKNLEKYRYAVGKIVFLEQYHFEYKLVQDIKTSNCMKVMVLNTNKTIIVSLFGQPTIDKKIIDSPVLVFYQKRFVHNSKRYDNEYRVFNKSFENAYDESIGLALIEPMSFYKKNKIIDIDLLDIFDNAIIAQSTEKQLFKYYSTAIQANKYGQLDGKISFMNPIEFNDPFDCNCVFKNGNSVSDFFRVFCSIESYESIPMWSYYGENHKGYCFEYSKVDITNELINTNLNILCIIGEVNYSSKRPDYCLPGNSLSYTNIKKYIDCTFTKYEEWKHEKEYRFVLISKAFSSANSAFQVSVPIINIYRGCNNDGAKLYNSSKTQLSTVTLKKDINNYSLRR